VCKNLRDQDTETEVSFLGLQKSLQENPDKVPMIRGYREDSSESHTLLDSIMEQSYRYAWDALGPVYETWIGQNQPVWKTSLKIYVAPERKVLTRT